MLQRYKNKLTQRNISCATQQKAPLLGARGLRCATSPRGDLVFKSVNIETEA